MSRTEEDERPWEQPGEFRRDGEPHRGALLRALSLGTVFLAYASICCPPVGATSAVLGVTVLLLARRDERLMRQGRMDPAGLPDLEYARHLAYFGIAIGLAMVLIVGSLGLQLVGWQGFWFDK